MGMRLPTGAYSAQRWRIQEITADFDVEDVWEVPARLTPETFPLAMQALVDSDISKSPSPLYRLLFAVRFWLGRVLKWDDKKLGTDGQVVSLAERLPDDLRACPGPNANPNSPFTPLYLTNHEHAAENSNVICHAVLHLGLVPNGDAYRVHFNVLVRPNGVRGRAYMAFIKPFRYAIVYPALLKSLATTWSNLAPPQR